MIKITQQTKKRKKFLYPHKEDMLKKNQQLAS